MRNFNHPNEWNPENQNNDINFNGHPKNSKNYFSEKQLNILIHVFNQKQYLYPDEKYKLSLITGLSSKQISNWFEHRRNNLKINRKNENNVNNITLERNRYLNNVNNLLYHNHHHHPIHNFGNYLPTYPNNNPIITYPTMYTNIAQIPNFIQNGIFSFNRYQTIYNLNHQLNAGSNYCQTSQDFNIKTNNIQDKFINVPNQIEYIQNGQSKSVFQTEYPCLQQPQINEKEDNEFLNSCSETDEESISYTSLNEVSFSEKSSKTEESCSDSKSDLFNDIIKPNDLYKEIYSKYYSREKAVDNNSYPSMKLFNCIPLFEDQNQKNIENINPPYCKELLSMALNKRDKILNKLWRKRMKNKKKN